jgi:hypothetical protein
MVLVMMNLFMMIIFTQMVSSTGRQVRRDAGRLLAIWHGENSKEPEPVETEKAGELSGIFTVSGERNPAAWNDAYANVNPPKNVVFHDDDFLMNYRKIRYGFESDPREAAQLFVKGLKPDQERVVARRKILESLMEIFTFDNTFRICSLTIPEQEQLLAGLLEPDALEVYQEWKEQSAGKDIVAFSSWLALEYQKLSQEVHVQFPAEDPEFTADQNRETPWTASENSSILFEPEPAICEGYRILYRDRLYDYSI